MNWRRGIVATALGLAAGALAFKYATDPLGSNFAWWTDLAANVLGGATPYVDSPDNKPPLWLAVVTAAEATGHASAVLRALTAVAGAAVVGLAYHVADRRHGFLAGLAALLIAAGLLWLVSNPANNKPVGAALALAAVAARDERHAGLLAGVAGTIAQQFGFILLAVGIARIVGSRWTLPQGLTAAKWVCVIVVGQYLVVGALFGPAALVAAVNQSVLAAVGYAAGSTAMPDGGVIGEKGIKVVLRRRWNQAFRIWFVLAAAGVGALFDRESLVWLAAAVPVLGMTVFGAYWVFAIPAVAVGGGIAAGAIAQGIRQGLTRRCTQRRFRRPRS